MGILSLVLLFDRPDFLAAFLAGCTAKSAFQFGDVQAVDIQLKEVPERQKAAEIRSTDAAKIDSLLAALRPRIRKAPDHDA